MGGWPAGARCPAVEPTAGEANRRPALASGILPAQLRAAAPPGMGRVQERIHRVFASVRAWHRPSSGQPASGALAGLARCANTSRPALRPSLPTYTRWPSRTNRRTAASQRAPAQGMMPVWRLARFRNWRAVKRPGCRAISFRMVLSIVWSSRAGSLWQPNACARWISAASGEANQPPRPRACKKPASGLLSDTPTRSMRQSLLGVSNVK